MVSSPVIISVIVMVLLHTWVYAVLRVPVLQYAND